MRVQGSGSVLSNPREQEIAIFQFCSTHNLGPLLYAVFQNGYVAEYIDYSVLAVSSLSSPLIYPRIAQLVAKWHSLKIPKKMMIYRFEKGKKNNKTVPLFAITWEIIIKWLRKAKTLYSNDQTTFKIFEKELKLTKAKLEPFCSDSLVLCHNDLNHGNMLWDEKKNQLVFVDLEFSGFNYRGFDIANHFCEWAGPELDYSKCPNEIQMKDWISIYIDYFEKYNGYQISTLPKSLLIERMFIEISYWKQVSHLFWWLWAMIQIKISNIENFDAVAYSEIRWKQYLKSKLSY